MYTQETIDTDATTLALPEGAIARLGRGQIGKMSFSPDGTLLAVPTRIGCWLYDLSTMTHIALWGTERGMLATASFSDDALWVATSDWDGVVKIWETQNLKLVAEIDVSDYPRMVRASANNLTFLQDGKHLAMNYTDVYLDQTPRFYDRQSAIYAWQTDTDTPITNYTENSERNGGNIRTTAFSADGSFFAFTKTANMTSVISMDTGEQIAELRDDYTEESGTGCHRLVFSPCGKYLAACNSGDKVHVWNVNSGTLEMEPTPYGGNRYIKFGIPAYTPEGNLRVAGIGGIEVMLWDAINQKTVDTFESWVPSQRSACFSKDGTRFAVTNGHGELHVWTEKVQPTLASLPVHHQCVNSVSFSKDSSALVSSHQTRSAVCVWNVASRQVKHTFHYRNSNPNTSCAMVTARGRELLATNEEKENAIQVWHLPSDTKIAEFTRKRSQVRNMVFSPNGEYLVSAGYRNPIQVWDVASGKQITELPRNPSSHVSKIGLSPTGEYFVIIYGDSIAVWDALQWEKLHHVPLTPQEYPGWKLVFHSNGKHLFTIPRPSQDTIVWELKSGDQIGTLDTAVCLDPALYKGNPEDLQRVPEIQNRGQRRIRALITSSRHNIVAGGMWAEIRVWDSNTLEEQMSLIPPIGCLLPFALTFSPCGNYLAAGSRWQENPRWKKEQKKTSIRLWDIATGENVHTFWAHSSDVLSLNFSPDGNLLASGSYDGSILLWDMKPFIRS